MGDRPLSDVRSAIIGSGFIASIHIEALRRLGVQLSGLLSRDPATAGSAHPGAHVYDSLDALCDDGPVDVVHVTSPNYLHLEHVQALLEARKHVICEKPLAVTVAEGRQLVAEAKRAGVVNATCFNLRYYPVLREAHELIAAGELGVPRLVTGKYLQDWLLRDTDWNWRADAAKGGRLRAASDIGSHWLDLATYLIGARVDEVFADLYTFVPTRYRPLVGTATFRAAEQEQQAVEPVKATNEDAGSVLLRFSSGARGGMTVSQVSPGHKNAPSIEVAGSEASISWDGEQPESLWIGRRGGRNEQLLRDPTLMSAGARRISHYPGGHVEGFGGTFCGLFEDIYADVATGTVSDDPEYPTFADGLAGLLVEDAIFASNEAGTWRTTDWSALETRSSHCSVPGPVPGGSSRLGGT
ncbi:MAG: Gfo/Idh/MocA family protein [Acidimicrobiales bacterium]